ncbi:MAG: putative S-adenosylmethionine-dependent methyltransferase [Syntrophomonadaceae bacterium]|nr:putative S-adenosylmethionine-dependent methyltransferase [Bacillota bacterium]
MGLEDEIRRYDRAEVSMDTGETELWDEVVFPNIIRRREKEIIFDLLASVKARTILDLGCGGGWLSKVLSAKGYRIIGIDISTVLIKTATKAASENLGFLVGDCMNLPFRDNRFDLIVGVGILHHLDPDKALAECHRVLSKNGSILFMEPNALSPLMTVGRKLVRVDICTEAEKPFVPTYLKDTMIKAGFEVKSLEYLFPYSFALAYLSGRIKSGIYQRFMRKMLPLIEGSEKVIESIPLIRAMSSTIVAKIERKVEEKK